MPSLSGLSGPRAENFSNLERRPAGFDSDDSSLEPNNGSQSPLRNISLERMRIDHRE